MAALLAVVNSSADASSLQLSQPVQTSIVTDGLVSWFAGVPSAAPQSPDDVGHRIAHMGVLAALVRATVADFPALHGGRGVLASRGDEQAADASVGA